MTRAEKLAAALLAAPDPLHAVAHALAEQDARIDAITDQIDAVRQTAVYARDMARTVSERMV